MCITDHKPLADRPPPDSPALRKLKRGWNTATYQERIPHQRPKNTHIPMMTSASILMTAPNKPQQKRGCTRRSPASDGMLK